MAKTQALNPSEADRIQEFMGLFEAVFKVNIVQVPSETPGGVAFEIDVDEEDAKRMIAIIKKVESKK